MNLRHQIIALSAILAIGSVNAADAPKTSQLLPQDSDVSAPATALPVDESPLAMAARAAEAGNAKKETPAAKEATAVATKPGAVVQSAMPAPATTPAPAQVTMPSMPAGAQVGAVQLGTQDVSFDSTPIEDVVRRLSWNLTKPVMISLNKSYRVTGQWRGATSVDVLRAIADTYGLTLREYALSYTLEEEGRDMTMGLASVKEQPKPVAGNVVGEPEKVAPAVTVSPVKTGLSKEQARIEKDLAEAKRRRAEILRQIDR